MVGSLRRYDKEEYIGLSLVSYDLVVRPRSNDWEGRPPQEIVEDLEAVKFVKD